MRLCPICTSGNRELLHALQLTGGEWQTIYACGDCGMVYATLAETDYTDNSIYTAPNAIGSGGTESDRSRLNGIVLNLLAHGVSPSAQILDVGCAQGGLLDALEGMGFTSVYGMDPSLLCVQATQARGHDAYVSTLEDSIIEKYDVLILSHVLEHIPDPIGALRGVKDRLNYGGSAYIEVPDASRYADFNLPFLDFNSEHINHFCGDTLAAACRAAGLHVVSLHLREIPLTNGRPYPAVWAWVTREPKRHRIVRARDGVIEYVGRSKFAMESINNRLERELGDSRYVTIWGAGSYLGNVLSLPAITSRQITQVVDRNPSLWGRWLGSQAGAVIGPDSLSFIEFPIVIAALIAAKSIAEDIRKMNIPAKVITLEELS